MKVCSLYQKEQVIRKEEEENEQGREEKEKAAEINRSGQGWISL